MKSYGFLPLHHSRSGAHGRHTEWRSDRRRLTLAAAFHVDWFEVLWAVGFAAVAVGLAVALRANARVAGRLRSALAEQERLAISDGLTGLHNQRFLDEVLKLEVERARRHDRPVGMVFLDLDGLAEVNHVHGRAGGDRVLVEAATRLLRCVRSSDALARYGGDEFAAVLADADSETVLEVAERCRASIASTSFALAGREATLTVSVGVACVPEHAQTPAELIGAAQDASALAKAEGRDAVRLADAPGAHAHVLTSLEGVGAITYLESVADEVDRRQGVNGHSLACAAWAGMLADALGLDEAARWRCVAAARFHDVGKVTIDEDVLCKSGRLSEDEWRRLREHPVQGARLVELATSLADVAPVIAEHHERPDGRGFPKGKIGGEIAVEARVVAVCDAWAAMLTDRPYRNGLSPDEARTELLTGSGTQFDSAIVSAFLALPAVRRRSVGQAPRADEAGPVLVRRPVG
jgi:two-component system, cell cycle response regulator